MLRIALCDDEVTVLQILRQKILESLDTLHMEAQIDIYSIPGDLLDAFQAEFVDAVFLDIDMPQMNGMQLAKVLCTGKKQPYVVFITNKSEFVYESFKYNAFRFIRKETIDDDLNEAVESLCKAIQKKRKKIVITNGCGVQSVEVDEIQYIETQSSNIVVHTADREYCYRYSINKLEKELKEVGFLRPHNGYLVNFRFIDHIQNLTIYLKNRDRSQIPISRHRQREVKEEFVEWLR
ncbi:MAG: LytR/AlgR family response regulator transcription factor [Oscillospiraceae bacterium]